VSKTWPHVAPTNGPHAKPDSAARSFWGWSEKEWLDSIKRGGHEKPSVVAAAYLLCRFNSLHELGRYNFLSYRLAIRVFGLKRIRSLFAELKAMLVEWGYRDRTARIYIPRAMCEVLEATDSEKPPPARS